MIDSKLTPDERRFIYLSLIGRQGNYDMNVPRAVIRDIMTERGARECEQCHRWMKTGWFRLCVTCCRNWTASIVEKANEADPSFAKVMRRTVTVGNLKDVKRVNFE